MKLCEYKKDIRRARDAGEVNELQALAESDPDLAERSVMVIQRAAEWRRIKMRSGVAKHSMRRALHGGAR
jgi:hypothetical protein